MPRALTIPIIPIILGLLSPLPARADSAATYATSCAICHGDTGAGDGPASAGFPVKPANFTDPGFWSTRTDEAVAQVIREGGTAVGKSPIMMGYDALLGEQGTADMVAWLKTLSVTSE